MKRDIIEGLLILAAVAALVALAGLADRPEDHDDSDLYETPAARVWMNAEGGAK